MSAPVVSPRADVPQDVAFAIKQLGEGRSNAVGVVTLAAGAGTTTVTAPNCGAGNKVFLFPCTANAAAIVAATYVAEADVTKGQFVVTHTNNANSDKTFFFACFG